MFLLAFFQLTTMSGGAILWDVRRIKKCTRPFADEDLMNNCNLYNDV